MSPNRTVPHFPLLRRNVTKLSFFGRCLPRSPNRLPNQTGLYGLGLGEIPNRLNLIGMPPADLPPTRYARPPNLAELAARCAAKNWVDGLQRLSLGSSAHGSMQRCNYGCDHNRKGRQHRSHDCCHRNRKRNPVNSKDRNAEDRKYHFPLGQAFKYPFRNLKPMISSCSRIGNEDLCKCYVELFVWQRLRQQVAARPTNSSNQRRYIFYI